jgi:GNAT superfamily N-acetyltransferase
VLSSPEFTARPAALRDVPVLVQLLEAYMRETFKAPWHGSAEALRRDGFGREFEIHVAMTGGEHVMGFLAWRKSYDLHHCLTGGEILDLYVSPDYRGRGVAPALVCAVAAEILRRGGTYVKGQAVEHRVVQRLYARFAMCFPGTDCIVGGRAFRRVAELAGRSAREVARSLPEKSWNYEP